MLFFGKNVRKRLGLAVTETQISAVEVAQAGAKKALLRSAELVFTEELNLDSPERLGKELKGVLRRNGLSASRCVIGLAAKWIVSRDKPLPAMDADSLRGAMSIATEREFASGAGDLSFDYCAWPAGTGLSALLAAAPRKVVEGVLAAAKAAGLSVKAVTCSAAALACASGPTSARSVGPGHDASGRVLLCLLPGGAEVVVQSDGALRLMRHLSYGSQDPDRRFAALLGELRRIFVLAPSPAASPRAIELWAWDCTGTGATRLADLADQLGLSLKLCKAGDQGGLSAASRDLPARFAQAAALACCAGETVPIDFLNSRLRLPRKARVGRRARWALTACLVFLAAAAYFFLDWRAEGQEVSALRSQLAGLKDGVTEAKSLVDSVSFARGWYDRRPPFLDCLREITAAFPQEGRIWATSLMIRQDMEAMLTGKSSSESAVLDVLDRLKSNPALGQVKPLYIRQAGGTSRDVSFAIGLRFQGATSTLPGRRADTVGPEPTPMAPAAKE